MKISKLIDGYCGECGETEASGVSFSPSVLKRGDLFFLLKQDAAYLSAAESMACAIVSDKEINASIPVIHVENARKSLALAAKSFSGNACDRLKIIAVTGTNGKTTTSYMLKSILGAAGKSVGLIGTNEIVVDGEHREASLTTPDPVELHALFAEMLRKGTEYVVMEASAHALALEKLTGIGFECVAFTNLTRDHLDFFDNMERYGAAKLRLFELPSAHKVVNTDDIFGKSIASKKNVSEYSVAKIQELLLRRDGSVFSMNINGIDESFTVRLPGRYNVLNALCAITCALELGIDPESIKRGLSGLCRVDGRFNVLTYGNASIVIDFAHTDDGLRNLLIAVREITTGKIKLVFGCGGNRDKAKRPLMGIAAALADEVFVTSDNPRGESPLDIIADVVEGIKSAGFGNYYIEPNRKKAIKLAFGGLEDGDCLVIAGKGNENYIEIAGVKYAYNDESYVKALMGER